MPFEYPGDTSEPPADRSRDVEALERWTRLLLSERAHRITHMRASVALALLRNDLNLSDIASHFRVTVQRVGQIKREIQAFETLPRRHK